MMMNYARKKIAGACLVLMLLFSMWSALPSFASGDPLPSWNEGTARQAIIEFVQTVTDRKSQEYVPKEERLATFDQDGTLWVEHPIYTQVQFTLDQVVILAPQHPEWKETEPFKTVLSGDRAAIAKLTPEDLVKIVVEAHAGMTVEAFQKAAKGWLTTAKHPRFQCEYTKLIYQPMLELINYLRKNDFNVYIVTGGGQEFVRSYANEAYGIPPEHVIGTSFETKFTTNGESKPELIRHAKLLLNNNNAGKAQDIYLFTGRRPQFAAGNTPGDKQMLQYTGAGSGAKLMMLVLHDDADREYAYGPAEGLPDSKIGTFPQSYYDEAIKNGWFVISMKKDWRKVFADTTH